MKRPIVKAVTDALFIAAVHTGAMSSAISVASAQDTVRIANSSIQSMLTVIAHDSMRVRTTGTAPLARAAAFVVQQLREAGVQPAGDSGGYLQGVPIVRRQLDLHNAIATDNGFYVPGVDFLPIVGSFGLATPDSVDIGRRTYVSAGQLGEPDALSPGAADGKFVVFAPPRRSDGEPDYQLWNVREELTRYSDAAAIYVASLDLMPRKFIAAMSAPRLELQSRITTVPPIPPIIALSRAASRKAVGSINQTLSYRTIETPLQFPATNVVAILPGSDPQLREEVVVLTAHLDEPGDSGARHPPADSATAANAFGSSAAGAVALLAIAQQLAALPVKPRRSIVFVWTTASAQGLLGTEYFADHPPVPHERIVAAINLDRLWHAAVDSATRPRIAAVGGRHMFDLHSARIDSSLSREGLELSVQVRRGSETRPDLPAVCDGDEWHFTRWGIPAVRFSTLLSPSESPRSDADNPPGFNALVRVTRAVGHFTATVADAPPVRSAIAGKPDPRVLCAR